MRVIQKGVARRHIARPLPGLADKGIVVRAMPFFISMPAFGRVKVMRVSRAVCSRLGLVIVVVVLGMLCRFGLWNAVNFGVLIHEAKV